MHVPRLDLSATDDAAHALPFDITGRRHPARALTWHYRTSTCTLLRHVYPRANIQ